MAIERRSGARGTTYEVRYRGSGGEQRSRSFKTLREARAYEAEQRSAVARGGWIDPRNAARLFETVAAEWATSNPSKRPSTLARDEVDLRVHVLPPLGKRQIGSITPADVQGLVNLWSSRAEPRTVGRRYGVVRAVMNHAVNNDLIARSPCRGIKLPSREPVDREIPTADAVVALAEAMGRYGPMVYLGAVLGMRWGEVAGLRVGRLDLDAGTCSVMEQVTRGLKGISVLGPPKSRAGRRVLSMPEPLTRMLTDHLATIGVSPEEKAAFVFPAPDGEHLIYSNWRQRIWLPACRTVGWPELGFHDLRRANATGLVAEGVDLKTAQDRLGHSDPRLTLAVYAQSTTEADRRAADRLGERFMPASPRAGSGRVGKRGKKQERPGPDQLGLGL